MLYRVVCFNLPIVVENQELIAYNFLQVKITDGLIMPRTPGVVDVGSFLTVSLQNAVLMTGHLAVVLLQFNT